MTYFDAIFFFLPNRASDIDDVTYYTHYCSTHVLLSLTKIMWKVRDAKVPQRKYRCYSPTSMVTALEKVRQTGAPIKTTAREFGIPEASLRHKLSGRVDPEATHSGPPPMFTQEEECHFVDHLKFMSECGYGYSRAEVVDMASEYAICLGKRDSEHPLSLKWFRGFMSRWPELKVLKPRGLEIQRAKATTVDCVTKYYVELGSILDKYSLKNRPERIYNVDEKGLSTSHTPPAVVTGLNFKPQAVTSASRTLVTVIGCGNALGYSVPPFFIFPGARMRPDLLEGGSAGTDGTVTESGWSNSTVFRRYIEHHLIKYLPERSVEDPVLVLYDGHKSHINLNLIDWAKTQNLILFILPAHTSHVLQPLDVGCFGPFERVYSAVCHKFMREHCGQSITRYNVCSLGCSAYSKALSAGNLQASFRKTGIYPYNPNAVDPSNFKPSEALQQETTPKSSDSQHTTSKDPSQFFGSKAAGITSKKPPTKKRRYLSYVVSGKAITEEPVIEQIKEHENAKAKKSTSPSRKSKSEPQPGPSGTARPVTTSADSDVSLDEDTDTDLCCVCNLFTPQEVRQSTSLIFVKWVQCTKCGHWVHLRFCTPVRVVRRGDDFLCKHCTTEE
ncbi:uncharacterized protein LOC128550335 [Mercenaria mercenaria]|uniref:uncharacterized protein LOC128550335 n=1 Tax=Mercenaria mercenaria TaxID=6596 RepID=UPI00234F1093|nr:uncharacterized protein LOC128550335 [Mercenaria mercenaria]